MWKVVARDWRKLECTADGAVRSLRFHLNNLVGSIPPELSWLSNSLSECLSSLGKANIFIICFLMILYYFVTSKVLLDVGSNNLTGPLFNELGLLTKLG
jgi:hypothetical protein